MMLRPRLGTAPCPDLRTDGFTGRDGPQVMDYMVSDLEMVIKDKACRLNPADIKAYMHMTLQAVAHCHQVRVNIPCASSEELRAPTCAAPLARLHMRGPDWPSSQNQLCRSYPGCPLHGEHQARLGGQSFR